MDMQLRSAPGEYILGDHVGAMPRPGDGDPFPSFGKIEEVLSNDEYMVRTGDGELTGPWHPDEMWHDPSYHVDYPHYPGTLYDCPACEASRELDND